MKKTAPEAVFFMLSGFEAVIEGYGKNVNCFTFLTTPATKEERSMSRHRRDGGVTGEEDSRYPLRHKSATQWGGGFYMEGFKVRTLLKEVQFVTLFYTAHMRYGKYGTSHLLMRWGLGVVFIWIGVNMFQLPEGWIGYLPAHIPFGLSREQAVQLIAASDIVTGVLLVLNRLPRLTALVAASHLAGILIVNGIDAVLIRDVGLFTTALALLFWPQHGYRKSRWRKLFKRKSKYDYDEE